MPGDQHGGLRAFGGVELFRRALRCTAARGRSRAPSRLRRKWRAPPGIRRRVCRACRPTGSPVREIRMRVSCLTWARSIAARDSASGSRRDCRNSASTSPPTAPYRCASTMVLRGARERHRAGELLVGKFRDDEHRENPAVEVAAPQVRQRPGRHHAVQRARRADIPVELRDSRNHRPALMRERREQIDSQPAQRRIVAREQRPHEHQPQAVEHGVFGVQVDEMRRQQPPPLPGRRCAARSKLKASRTGSPPSSGTASSAQAPSSAKP